MMVFYGCSLLFLSKEFNRNNNEKPLKKSLFLIYFTLRKYKYVIKNKNEVKYFVLFFRKVHQRVDSHRLLNGFQL